MGETGCGKTHLIQYMCDLMLLGSGWDREKAKNLFILKVFQCNASNVCLCNHLLYSNDVGIMLSTGFCTKYS